MLIRVCDLETDGLDPSDRVVEIGWCDIVGDSIEPWVVGKPSAVFVDPGRPIRPQAMAVHHITDADVAGAPSFTEASGALLEGAPFCLAAHQAKFERQFFTTPASWLCTYKMALHLAPNAPGWSNQVLRYWLNLNVDRALASPVHRAGPDAYVTAHLLARMLAKISVEEAIAVSNRPALLPKLTFGMHAMQPIRDVPTSYFEWILKQPNMDEDAVHTARHHIEQRRAESRARSPV